MTPSKRMLKTMVNDITLFDLPSKNKSACWSLNPWKARLVLNYKGLPYKTQWIEYPDVAPTLKSYGIPPNSKELNPKAEYSIPAACINGDYIMDSLSIAKKIEQVQPEPPLHLDSSYIDRAQEAVLKVMAEITPIAMPRVPKTLLNPSSAKYFEETRAERFGMPLSELAKSEKATTALDSAQPALGDIKALLHENGGPFVLGNEPSFADFVLAGFWRFTELLDNDGDLYGRIIQYDSPSFSNHYEACKKWMERVD